MRLYLYGLVLLAAVATSLAIFGAVIWRGPPQFTPVRIARYVDEELSPLLDRPNELRAELERLHTAFQVEVAVYRPGGELVAQAGTEPPAALEQIPSEPTLRRGRGGHDFSMPLAGGAAYLVGRARWEGAGGTNWIIGVALVMVVLALVSLPVARGIARPIERITQAARALGAGDLSARTGLWRRDEVGELARAFDDMAARLESLVQNEKELLANVSHELRTPMARIRVALELVEEGGASGEKLREHLRGIGGDLRELEQLVDQVLLTARLDLGNGLPLARAPVSMADLVADAAARFATLHPDHRLETEVQPELPEVEADAALLHRVLDNLLDNAAKYAAPDAGVVSVEVAYDGRDAPIVVSVRDHGIGVEDADLPQLFEAFFRSDRSRERGTGGVGLGLALCRRIVSAHGGTIEALLPEDGGLEVRFTVPLLGSDPRGTS